VIPEFDYRAGWAGPRRVEDLVGDFTWEQPTIRVYGRECAVPRLTCWMGDAEYTYSGVRHFPMAMPPWLAAMRDRLEGELGCRFNSVLANYYRGGADSVAWHADDEPELGPEPTIASVSLGAARRFLVRPREHKLVELRAADDFASRLAADFDLEYELGFGDLLVMRGRSQADYLHSVPKTRREVGPRLNLTFRRIVAT
jgi:alkylated DNA repair dioxygenase AlkB